MILIALQVLLSGSRSIRKTFPSASKRHARTNPSERPFRARRIVHAVNTHDVNSF
jgi:hypothetical protein